jgi:hypothetical protein
MHQSALEVLDKAVAFVLESALGFLVVAFFLPLSLPGTRVIAEINTC